MKTGTKEYGSKIAEKYNRINVRGLEKKFTKTETVARVFFFSDHIFTYIYRALIYKL